MISPIKLSLRSGLYDKSLPKSYVIFNFVIGFKNKKNFKLDLDIIRFRYFFRSDLDIF